MKINCLQADGGRSGKPLIRFADLANFRWSIIGVMRLFLNVSIKLQIYDKRDRVEFVSSITKNIKKVPIEMPF